MSSSNLQALRDNRNNWSLADDRQLCNTLEQISSSLATKIGNAADAIQENSLKISNACVQVSNLNNRLSSFASDQFIESRVGDEAVVYAKPIAPASQQTAAPNKQAEATENLRAAVSMGLELMRTRFKRIDMRPEDFDEDDDPTFMPEPIFEPYDESLSRPLPFLIGTPDWMSSCCAGTSEEYAETTKVSEEVVISLPPFAQPRIAVAASTDSSQSNPPLAEKTLHGAVASSRATSSASSNESFEPKISSNNYSHEYDNSRIYAQQETVPSSGSRTSLLKEAEVEKVTDTIPDSSNKEIPRRYPQPSARYPVPDAPVRRTVPELSVSRNLVADSAKDQLRKTAKQVISNNAGRLFSDSSDDDDLFNDAKNTGTKPKRYNVESAQTGDSHVVLPTEQENMLPPKADVKIRSSPTPTVEAPQLRNPLLEPDDLTETPDAFNDAVSNDRRTTETSPDAFRKKLDGLLSNKMASHAVNGIQKQQQQQVKEHTEETMENNDEINAVLPSLAKLRAKGPPRRSPSRLLQQSSNSVEEIKEEVQPVIPKPVAVMSTNAEKEEHTVPKEAEIHEERHMDPQQTNPGKRSIPENLPSVKQRRNDISSIFSSDSDDDIFSTLSSSRPKSNAAASKARSSEDRKPETATVPVASERRSITSTNHSGRQTAKTVAKSKNLFDSDDEDIFSSSNITATKRQQSLTESSKKAVPERTIRGTVPEKTASGKTTREAVPEKTVPEKTVSGKTTYQAVPKKGFNATKPKRVDIFGDDSDDDDLFK